MGDRPLFSIGLATYNRKDALRRCIDSILAQTYGDFELIVGNDYPLEQLSSKVIGIDDPRIRFVNHPQNLGEFGNLKALLEMGNGAYFTWQFDDDLYAPNFLESVHSALRKFNHPPCVFTSYQMIRGNSTPHPLKAYFGSSRCIGGRQFLRLYLSGKIHVMGLAGVYEAEYLRKSGGFEHISNSPFALYSEYSLLLHAGLVNNVAYIGAPLIYYRAHEGSWSTTNTDVETYRHTGLHLVRKSIEVLSRPPLREDFGRNVLAVSRLVFYEFVEKSSQRAGISSVQEAKQFWTQLTSCFESPVRIQLQPDGLLSLRRALLWFPLPFLIGKFKATAPSSLVKLTFKLLSVFQRRRFFRF
jgi:hypothetical protein